MPFNVKLQTQRVKPVLVPPQSTLMDSSDNAFLRRPCVQTGNATEQIAGRLPKLVFNKIYTENLSAKRWTPG